jgi:hypothetical protein
VEKFKIPKGTSYEQSLAMIADELNRLNGRLTALIENGRRSRYDNVPTMCACDVEYNGAHWPHCPHARGKQ